MSWDSEYIIPEDIKVLCAKKDLSDETEQDKVKEEIIRYVKEYLDLKKGKNSWANISGIVKVRFNVIGTNYNFERDIAGRMARTRNYSMQEFKRTPFDNETREAIVIPADRKWYEKHAAYYAALLVIIGGLIPFIKDFLPNTKEKETHIQVQFQKELPQVRQNDSLSTPLIDKKDSAKH